MVFCYGPFHVSVSWGKVDWMQIRRCGFVINYVTGVAGYIWFVRNVKHFFTQPITCTSGRSELFCKLNIRLWKCRCWGHRKGPLQIFWVQNWGICQQMINHVSDHSVSCGWEEVFRQKQLDSHLKTDHGFSATLYTFPQPVPCSLWDHRCYLLLLVYLNS